MDRSSACGESGEATSWASWGFFRGELALLIMATLVVGAWVNSKLFRWESSEPLNKRAMLTAILVLTLLYAAAAMLAPAFEMVRPPSVR